MSKAATTYKKNYEKLKKIADTLKNQNEPDIDQLIPLVTEATEAYKTCQARIDAVEKALGLVESDTTKETD